MVDRCSGRSRAPEGDSWLQQNMGDYAEWAKTHNSLLIVTFDEGEEDGINHIPTIIYGAGVVPGEYTQAADHYDLLRTIEDLYGLLALGHAAEAEVMLYGLVDSDTVEVFQGTAGADRIKGGDGSDAILGLAGDDRLFGLGNSDRLHGGAGADRLRGGTGADILEGGKGQDHLNGGTNDLGDAFVFSSRSHSPEGAHRDVIENFSHGVDDLDLRGIDARPGSDVDNAFAWAGRTAAAHSVWWEARSNSLLVCADVTGDTRADFEVLLKGVTSFGPEDMLP